MASEADAPAIEHLDVAASPETPTVPVRLPKLTLKPPEVPPPPPSGAQLQHHTPDSYAGSSRSRSESASADVDAERFANAEDDEQDELETTPPFRMPTPPSLSSIPPAPSLMAASTASTPTPPISLPAARGRGRGRPKGSLNKRKREGGGTGRGGKAKATDAPPIIMNLPAPPRAPEIPPLASGSGLKFQFESFGPSNPAPPDAAEPPSKKRKTNKEKAPKAKAGTITIPPQASSSVQMFSSAPPLTHIPPPPQIDNIPPPPVHRYVEPQPVHTGPPRLPNPPQPPMPGLPMAPTPPKPPKPPKQPKAAKSQVIAEPIPASSPQAPSPAPTSPTLTAAPLPVPGEGGPSAAELLEGVPVPRYPLPTRPFAVKPPPKIAANTWASNPPLDRTKLPTRRWRPVQREIRGIAGGRWFAKSWAGGDRSPLKGEGMGLGLVVEHPVGSARPAVPLPMPPAPPSLGSLPPFGGPSGSVTPAGFSLPPTPGVSGMPTGLAALATASAAAQHLAVPQDNGDMVVDE